MPASPLLELRQVSKRFGRVVVAEDISFALESGATLGVVGPNGAGKTSLFGVIAGDLRADAGDVLLEGRSVARLGAAARCRLGIGRTHQVPHPFEGMTVFENALVAAQQGAGLRRSAAADGAVAALERAGLRGSANTTAGRLGLLSRKRLEIARALATGPRLLLLDEVAGGLTDPEVAELAAIVKAINATGVTVIWIEHVLRALLSTVDRLICLAAGAIVADGPPEQVLAEQGVREVFLGVEAAVLQGGAGPDTGAAG